jgi:flagellar FliL protein
MSDAKPAEAPVPAPKKKGKMKLFVTAGVVVALGVGGGWYAMRRPASAMKSEASASRGLVTFEPFVVNLADPGGSRFIRITLSVVVDDEKVASKITDTPVSLKEARSAILELLSEQNSAGLVTPEGKQALKKAIIERVSKIFVDAKVTDVYFAEFVVQF